MYTILNEQCGDRDSICLDHGGDVLSWFDAKYAETLFRVSAGDST